MAYNPQKIERKWQKKWLEEKVFAAHDASKKEKFYQLETFPYPSAAGLHVGHPKGYIAEDIHARFMRMQGKEVLYTMGWDAFGLPTENYAIKVGKAPKEVAEENIKNFKRQVQMFGLSYDWDREINTSDPSSYKWTQWLFIQLFKKGLAYRKKANVNWCPKDQTVLANEQVVQGLCERCGSEVEQREMEQWFLKITDYAEQLLDDLKGLDWPEETLKRQADWIGRSEGAEIEFIVPTKKENEFPTSDTLKIHPDTFHLITAGEKTITLRPVGELKAREGDFVKAVTKTGKALGVFQIVKIEKKIFSEIPLDMPGHEIYTSAKERMTMFETFYKREIDQNEIFEIIHFSFSASIIPVFTTRPDTLFGATYLVLAPEHEIISNLKSQISNLEEIETYIASARKKTELMRKEEAGEKTGVELKGVKAINPATKEEIPIWVADYVLMGYGTGAIMAVPAHDERDSEFAKKYRLPVREVVEPMVTKANGDDAFKESGAISERTAVVAIIKHWSEDKYLGAEWLKTGWRGFVIGGIEKGEDAIAAGLREIVEETGYENPEFVQELGGTIHARFFQMVKNENRLAHFTPLLFRLKDGSQREISDEDKKLHKMKWLSPHEFDSFITNPDMRVVWNRVMGNYIYSGDGLTDGGKFDHSGILINSGEFNGLDSQKAKWEITKFVGGEKKVQYRIRDWSVSRQRYWGVPIPMVHCEKCALRDPSGQGIVPVPEKDLPVVLPDLENYRPQGMPPLASSEEFINTKCPQCKGAAKRDAETLDTFVDSSWYYLRYTDPHNEKAFAEKKKVNHWMPTDLYVIGAEHTVLHLLYSRFITKFLHDEGYLKFTEPFKKIRHVGLILGADGQKMSKSKGNVVNPDELVDEFGADTVRLYEMFMGPFHDGQPWDPKGIIGAERFLKRVWKLQDKISNLKSQISTTNDKELTRLLHKTIKKVGEDIRAFQFNTAISAMMILLNEIEKSSDLEIGNWKLVIKLLHPFAPHITQELWSELGHDTYLDFEGWPTYDSNLVEDEMIELLIQVNGKLRGKILVPKDITQIDAEAAAKGDTDVAPYLTNGFKKVVFVPGRLINFVV